jgi:uncharacterized membrane protein
MLSLRLNLVSLESGKKHGFTASMINIIVPVISVAVATAFILYQFSSRLSMSASPFLVGLFTGFFVALGVASLVGLILFFLAMHQLSSYYREPIIFKNILYGFLIEVIGGAICIISYVGFIATITRQAPQVTSPSVIGPVVAQIIIGFAAVFLIALICSIINAVLYWHSFIKLSEKSGVDAFKTAGLLYLIGTLLSIILVGVILVWIAWIYAAKGYRQLQPQSAPAVSASAYTPAPPTATPPSSGIEGRIYCSHCGAENDFNAIYCKKCGQPLRTQQTSV